MPDDHSKVEPLLPIPNRTVKRLCADDSADARVKVGHRQALTAPNTPSPSSGVGVLVLYISVRIGFSGARKLPSDGHEVKNWCILQGFADH